jgi:hypothetical protein
MKRSTLIIFLIAAVAIAGVYFFETRTGDSSDETAETKPSAFNFTREDITGITIARKEGTITLENQNNKWVITEPVKAAADETAMNSLVGDLVTARVQREFPPDGGDLSKYGLSEPAVKLEIKLKSGQTHKIAFGASDEITSTAFSQIDGSQNVSLLPVGLLNDTNKSLNDIRDRSVLSASQYDLSSVRITNESGSFDLEKNGTEWNIKSPVSGPADESLLTTILADITNAKAVEIVSENIDDPAKYGFDKSKVSITARLNTGGEQTVSVGSKVDENYYAKISDRPQLIKVDSVFYEKLNTKVATLRSKQYVKLDREALAKVYIKNQKVTFVAEKKDDKWMVTQPADQKDKEASTFKMFTPLETAATEVIDKPSGAIASKLASPAIEVRLTDKSGKTTTIKISSADGDNVYIKVDGRPEVYRVERTVFDGLNFKADEAVN